MMKDGCPFWTVCQGTTDTGKKVLNQKKEREQARSTASNGGGCVPWEVWYCVSYVNGLEVSPIHCMDHTHVHTCRYKDSFFIIICTYDYMVGYLFRVLVFITQYSGLTQTQNQRFFRGEF